jgi:hypothetical protein
MAAALDGPDFMMRKGVAGVYLVSIRPDQIPKYDQRVEIYNFY